MPVSYTYDPTTGKWGTTTTPDTPTGGTDKPTTGGDTPTGGGDNLQSSTPDNQTATGKTEQEANEIEINTLVGQLSFIMTEDTIKIKAGDTLNLKGLGKYLSGKYYVKEMNRQISSRGYSHNAVVIKTDFGDSLKVVKQTVTSPQGGTPTAASPKPTKQGENKPQAPTGGNKNPTTKVQTKKGDTWFSLAAKAIKETASKVATTVVTISAVASAIQAANKSAVASVKTTIAAKPVTVTKPVVGTSVSIPKIASKNILLKK